MTGRKDVFFELDRAVQGTVKFGDGSVVTICGKGTLIFSGRRDESKVLTGVYWIPRLKDLTISIGQMDEDRLALVPLVGFRINSQTKNSKEWCCRMQLLHMYCSLYIGLITGIKSISNLNYLLSLIPI
jgi:hypothetical protein